MQRNLLKSKIHRATVTQADLHYEGSCSIDSQLLEAADIVEHEEIHIWNVTNGSRLTTYAIPAPAGSGIICLNGAAAHLTGVGDIVIIASFVQVDERERAGWVPRVLLVDERNRIKNASYIETPGPDLPVA